MGRHGNRDPFLLRRIRTQAQHQKRHSTHNKTNDAIHKTFSQNRTAHLMAYKTFHSDDISS